jgi:LuxR family maltose regulon positive regulatory protein
VPKHAHALLIWSVDRATYELREGSQTSVPDTATWANWLAEHRSFAFQGRHGRLNLLKEQRKAGAGYWYAYRRQGGRVAKRYAGRGSDLTWTSLEALALALGGPGQATGVPQLPASAVDPDETGGRTTGPLLAPKLQPPRLHHGLVPRDRLLAQLDAGRDRKLTLLSAPAGFGKTTVLRQWLQHRADSTDPHSPPPRIAWLALDRSDNDPLRFWRYLITACRPFGPEVGTHSLAPLDAPISIKSPLDMILTVFLNELAQLPRACILVLEDYHLITTPQIHDAVGILLDHLPPPLRLVMSSRTQPPLPLARLAAAGDLSEITAPDLRFSGVETAAFLDQATTRPLQPGQIALVESHLEGWVAGLRLLTLALEGRATDDIAPILATLLAGRRGIGEYFVAEVLQHQPVPLQLFLLQTSFLGRLSASLCDSMTGRTDSQTLLETLYDANLFLEPLDERGLWYRYHALFATAMQGTARRRLGAAAVHGLLACAGRWYETHGFTEEAIEMAFGANDPGRAADLIELVAGRQFTLEGPETSGPPEFHTLHTWIARLPSPILEERPLLNLALAVAILFTTIMGMQSLNGGVSSEIEHLFGRAERGFRAAGDTGRLGLVFAFRALMVRERGEIAAAVSWARAALDALPPAELNWRSTCIGTLALGESVAGRQRAASTLFAEAQAICQQTGNRQFARASTILLGWSLVEQNELQRAGPLIRQTLAEARAVGDLDDIANALHVLAEIALCAHDLDAAWVQASEVVDVMGNYPHQHYYVHAVLILARVEQARGHGAAAGARCDALLREFLGASMPADKQLVAQITYEQTRIALAMGDVATVRRWRDTRPTDLEVPRAQHDREELLLARLLMAEGHPAAAAQILESILAAAEADGRERVALELRVLLARAFAATGRPHDARQVLAAALASAWSAHAQGVLIAEGEALAPLLRVTLPTLADPGLRTFTRAMLHQLTPAEESAGTDLLSAQERRVLRLLAAGCTNTAIAADLVVSVNTVKVHVKSIYRKLNVTNRIEAASVARDLGLREH